MLKKALIIITLAVGSTLLITGNALTLTIDFTDPYYSEIATKKEGSFRSDKDKLTLYALPSSSTDPPDRYLTWYDDDGIGVGGLSYEEDEVEWREQLEIVFDKSVKLSEIHLTDLFYEERQGQSYGERGMVFFYDESKEEPLHATWFLQDDPNVLNGEYVIDVAALIGADTLVNKISLTGFGYIGPETSRQDHEFSVAGLNVNPVPEPATMLLLGSGLIGLAGFRKRFKRK